MTEGQELAITALPETIADTLLIVDGDKVEIGEPSLGNRVKVEVVGQEKGEKVHIRRYRAKSRYRRHVGFRPSLTRFKVVAIGLTPSVKEDKKIKEEPVTSEVKKEIKKTVKKSSSAKEKKE